MFLRLILAVLLGLFALATPAMAYLRAGPGVMPSGNHRLRTPAPPVLSGDGVAAGLDFNFASGSFFQTGQAGTTPAALLTVTRASTKLCDDLAGNWAQVATNVLCYSNKGALIEEARTNSLTTTDLTNATLWGVINSTATGAQPSPDGGTNASLIVPTVANVPRHVFSQNVGVTGTVAAWTGSVFIKPAGYNFGFISIFSPYATLYYTAVVNLLTGVITQNNSLGSPAGTASVATVYPNGWVRIQVTMTATTGVSGLAFGPSPTGTPTVNTAGGGEPSFAGDGTSGVLVWQPQLELGVFATSPVPTAGAAATRAADVVKPTTNPTTGALYTLYASGTPASPASNATTQVLLETFITAPASGEGYLGRVTPIGQMVPGLVAPITASGPHVVNGAAGNPAIAQGTLVKAASAFANAGTPITTFAVGSRNSNFFWSGYISRVALWPATALTTGALQSITSGGGP